MPLTVSIDTTRTIEPSNGDEKYTVKSILLLFPIQIRFYLFLKVYQISVRGGFNHLSHTIDHRYREFEGLHSRLSSNLSLPHLPRKVLLHRRSAKLIEQRRQLLEIYLNEIIKRCQQQSIMPEDLARFLQLPPYDNDSQINRKDQQQQEQDSNDEEMKYILEHAPCISINDHWPWNDDHQGLI